MRPGSGEAVARAPATVLRARRPRRRPQATLAQGWAPEHIQIFNTNSLLDSLSIFKTVCTMLYVNNTTK